MIQRSFVKAGRPIIKVKQGRLQCPWCILNSVHNRPWETRSNRSMSYHLNELHSQGRNYHFSIGREPTRRGNYPLTITGPCQCGCGETIVYSRYFPGAPPPYYKSGHKSRVQHNNKGRFKPGQVSWNKGTKGLMKANAGTFKKGNKPHNDRNGLYTAPNGQVFEWTGEYQPCGVRKYKPRARRVMEETLKRFLKKSEVVVHLDNNPANDDPKNLKVITRRDNARRNGYIFRSEPNARAKLLRKKLIKKEIIEKHGDKMQVELECEGTTHWADVDEEGVIHSDCSLCNGLLLTDIEV